MISLLLSLCLLPAWGQSATRDVAQKDQSALPAAAVEMKVLEGRRFALCLANQDYQGESVDLRRPIQDAELVCKAAKEAGFELLPPLHNFQTQHDVQVHLEKHLDPLLKKLSEGQREQATLLVYYAGHAFQAKSGEDYMVGTYLGEGAGLEGGAAGTVGLLWLQKQLVWTGDAQTPEHRKLGLVSFFMDGCRNYTQSNGVLAKPRSISDLGSPPGAARLASPGYVLQHSTQSGYVASDQGLYAATLADELKVQGREIGTLLRSVSARVSAATKASQVPTVEMATQGRLWYPAGRSPVAEAEGSGALAELDLGLDLAQARLEAQDRLSECLRKEEAKLLEQARRGRAALAPFLSRQDAAARQEGEGPARTFVQTFAGARVSCTQELVGKESRAVVVPELAEVQAWLRALPAPAPTSSAPRPAAVVVPGLTWVRIPAGEGVVGDIQVKFSEDFYMLETEVTNAQFAAQVKGHTLKDNRPVVNVTWSQARDYCLAIGGHLPTELEWEYAARAGSKGDYGLNAEGQEIARENLSAYAVFGTRALADARSKLPNRWGLYGMYGNAWEWVADGYDAFAYSKLRAHDGDSDREGKFVNGSDMYEHVSGGTPDYRVHRGGGFNYGARNLRSDNRYVTEPGSSEENLGFRCVTSAPQP